MSHPLGHLAHINGECVADLGDLVHEGDLRSQECVGGVLDHLSCVGVGDEDRAVGEAVKVSHPDGGFAVAGANHHPIRVEEVVDRCAFPQEFGVGHHVHRTAVPPSDQPLQQACRADRRGALLDYNRLPTHQRGDGAGSVEKDHQVRLAVGGGGGLDGHEDVFAARDALFRIECEAEAALSHPLADQRLKAWFVDGELPPAQALHLLTVDIQTGHPVAQVREAGAGDEANISRAYDRNLHRSSLSGGYT